ncbi:MAG: cytochrome c [Nitrospinota bacterium]|nr:cytochrome c [Nitrospinota bacterium]
MKTLITLVTTLLFLFTFSASAKADPMKGEELFKKKCAACHNINDKAKVGPGLAGITKRHTDAWLTKWIADPQAVWKENDKETQELKSRMKDGAKRDKTKMKLKIDSNSIPDIIDYLKTL